MNYHVHTADGKRIGPKSLDEIRAALAAGELRAEGALAWTDGMAQWAPLASVLGLPPGLPSQNDGIGAIIPLKNGKALVAYYCGIFGIIPCVSWLLGPLALGFGIAGLRARRLNPSLPGQVHAWVGIVLGALETIFGILFLIGVVCGMLSSMARHH